MKEERKKANVTGPAWSVPQVIGPGIDQSELVKLASHIINYLTKVLNMHLVRLIRRSMFDQELIFFYLDRLTRSIRLL